ncbi:unnamed protein product [Heterobilharzia americana]|nr:unnamed protein product [Heterobilharzia americana]CAH8615246.1 unnamed protein product [Heterobilharzia americana]
MEFITNNNLVILFTLLLFSIQNVNAEVVFNLRSFLVSIWKSFCLHYADTLRFFLRGLPKSLGGDRQSMK